MAPLLDTHYHFDFLRGVDLRAAFVRELASLNSTPGGSSPAVRVVAQTIKPSEFVELIEQAPAIAERAGVAVDDPAMPLWSLGFHPWQIKSEEQAERDLAVFRECLAAGQTRFIGEIGLDFAPRRLRQASADLQLHVFRSIVASVCDAARVSPPSGAVRQSSQPENANSFILSIHAVRAASDVLDTLEDLNVCECNVVPVIHWFSGTSDELTRLIKLGGYISVNAHMLESKRGRAYAKQVPAERLLLETDLPAYNVSVGLAPFEQEELSIKKLAAAQAGEHLKTLNDVVEQISNIRGTDIASLVVENQQRLYA